MADTLRLEVLLVALGDAAAELLRGLGLAAAGDVSHIALAGEESAAARVRWARARARPPVLAARECERLEHALHGLEVILGGEIHHRVVLVVEAAMGFGA